jgi:hypothetical protein
MACRRTARGIRPWYYVQASLLAATSSLDDELLQRCTVLYPGSWTCILVCLGRRMMGHQCSLLPGSCRNSHQSGLKSTNSSFIDWQSLSFHRNAAKQRDLMRYDTRLEEIKSDRLAVTWCGQKMKILVLVFNFQFLLANNTA